MTALEITTLYRHAAPVFAGNVSAWMLMMEICATGQAGMTHADIMHSAGARTIGSRTPTIQKWLKAGLLDARYSPANARKEGRYRGGRPRVIYTATRKAHDLLRIQRVREVAP